jgi:hypothetical protein
MKRYLALLLVPAVLLSACASVPAPGSNDQKGGAEVTTEDLGNALATPLRDINLVHEEIPAVLMAAATAPYARPEPMTCAQITALLLPLNGALGPDIDQMKADTQSLEDLGGEAILDAIADFAASAIPYRSWVRKLSGADAQQKRMRAAVAAGAVRRAYLKGLGEQLGCPPPATPNRAKAPAEK